MMEVGDRIKQLMDQARVSSEFDNGVLHDCGYQFNQEEMENLILEVVKDCARVSHFFYHPMYNYQARCGKEITEAIEKKYGIEY
jgi:hypothetical protein